MATNQDQNELGEHLILKGKHGNYDYTPDQLW